MSDTLYSTQKLDYAVKGSPIPNTPAASIAASPFANPPPHNASDRLASLKAPRPPAPVSAADPTSLLPSSPPQIYLNLLILEASLRSQYLTLRARRRQNTFVLTLLALWIAFFTYLLWLRPREDGKGIGGSQYWLVDMTQKLCFITGLLTALLFWVTGQWERGVRWPRRWIYFANRGLRGMNVKIVIMRGRWWKEVVSWLAFMVPFSGGLWGGEAPGSSYHYLNLSQERGSGLDAGGGVPRHKIREDGREYAEEDIAPGGDYVRLMLLPKPFSAEFREGWEVFRQEYWERENERRAELRRRVKARRREIAKAEGGWLWWTGWRGWKRARGGAGLGGKGAGDVERHGHHHRHTRSHSLSTSSSLKEKEKERKRRPSVLKEREGSQSRSSSRSTTPTPDLDDRLRPQYERERRWSSSTTGSTATRSDSRRKRPSTSTVSAVVGTAQSARPPPVRLAAGSRPTTPNESVAWQSRRTTSLREGGGVGDKGKERDADGAGIDGSASGPSGQPQRPQNLKRGGSSRKESFVFPNAPSA
ncbi:Spo7-domain-containing protein [Westerdykella ornata]|uniref:Spo7-domain-containing protein n=1 Tax=Westerdykella ornata TaxID=318751 RepID=A0A6A6J6J2_WESOR|nr:Spo7-domain-containing protein [Westerdykella ornata]KAF2272012.1 Spo7-domain-containing protein [Westerdykella ornata]